MPGLFYGQHILRAREIRGAKGGAGGGMIFRRPRQTEYKGVVFKSKSEAIVARAFDMSGFFWEYEPQEWKIMCGWAPDFKLTMPPLDDFNTSITFCIEYKPRMPTTTYINELRKRLELIDDKLNGIGKVILIGNPFDKRMKRGVLWMHEQNKEIDEFPSIIHWEKAREYRFDFR